MSKHKKHVNILRKQSDNYAPNEVAILGAKCTIIASLVKQVSNKLSNYNLAYFDASHAKDVVKNSFTEYTFHHQGNLSVHTVSEINPYIQKLQFSQHDLVFINGNHYKGAKQILILDAEKEASIKKRIDQITNIQFIIKLNPETTYFDCLKEKFPEIENVTCYQIGEVEKITNHINNLIKEHIAPVKGLVLIGGKSTRMGRDKSQIHYYDKPQKEFVKELLENNQVETFYSVREFTKKQPEISVDKNRVINKEPRVKDEQDCCPSDFTDIDINSLSAPDEIPDRFFNLGPFGGICSAFQKDPNTAWFVLATDVPFVDEGLVKLLLEKRNPSKVATTVRGKSQKYPEPLITIYEPKAYPILLQYLALGYSCPRKMLINSDVEIIDVDDALIRNINTPEQYESVKKELS